MPLVLQRPRRGLLFGAVDRAVASALADEAPAVFEVELRLGAGCCLVPFLEAVRAHQRPVWLPRSPWRRSAAPLETFALLHHRHDLLLCGAVSELIDLAHGLLVDLLQDLRRSGITLAPRRGIPELQVDPTLELLRALELLGVPEGLFLEVPWKQRHHRTELASL